MIGETELKDKIVSVLKEQGFAINPHVKPAASGKDAYRAIQYKSRIEQLSTHCDFLCGYFEKAKQYCRDGKNVIPDQISLELREVQSGSAEDALFRWWNLIWWSIPYQRPYGRQMRFLLWDKNHDGPFGLIGLQSPILKMSVRDKFLQIPRNDLDYWVNKSMHAQRIGALPPYNQFLGGKMAALTLSANEIRMAYANKYMNYKTIIRGADIGTDLLFITTTSAFGKSSLYNRLKYKGETVAESLGYTQGCGSFHVPENLYSEMIRFLAEKGKNVSLGYGHGPSRKLRLLSMCFRCLGLPEFERHNIKREFYLFALVRNLKAVINNREPPMYVDRPFKQLEEYWKERWALPRSIRKPQWKEFDVDTFFDSVRDLLEDAKRLKYE